MTYKNRPDIDARVRKLMDPVCAQSIIAHTKPVDLRKTLNKKGRL